MKTLAQGRGMAGEKEVSRGIGLMGNRVMAVVALLVVVGLRVHVDMFVAAVKSVDGALV